MLGCVSSIIILLLELTGAVDSGCDSNGNGDALCRLHSNLGEVLNIIALLTYIVLIGFLVFVLQLVRKHTKIVELAQRSQLISPNAG